MEKSEYSPAGEFFHQWWTERIKPFLNFKQYLAQRREILERPELALETRTYDDQTWRSPLQFAIQGNFVPTLLLSLLTSVFFFFAGDPPTTDWKVQRAHVDSLIAIMASGRDAIAQLPETASVQFDNEYSPRRRDDALKEANRRLAVGTRQLWLTKLAPHVDQAENVLRKFMIPFALILGAYFFKIFLRTGQGRHAVHTEQASKVYLYVVTSRLFWLALVGAVCIATTILSIRTDHDTLAAVGYAGLVASGLVSLFVLNSECRRLSLLFGMPLLEGKQRRNSGHNKVFSAIFFANVTSLLLSWAFLFVGSWVWGIGKMAALSLRPGGGQ